MNFCSHKKIFHHTSSVTLCQKIVLWEVTCKNSTLRSWMYVKTSPIRFILKKKQKASPLKQNESVECRQPTSLLNFSFLKN